MEKLLNVDEAAVVLGTSSRFPRRLIAELRLRLVRVGRHVRIPVSALEGFVSSGTFAPVRFHSVRPLVRSSGCPL
mgnify:CR=1 FL=1